ncbi:MAG: hypothetical protein IBX72_00325 [Nitrospirae bacterium]|nr:hypothetical protein [Nitrospirota bacterium]
MKQIQIQETIYRNSAEYHQVARYIEEVFYTEAHKLQKVREIAFFLKIFRVLLFYTSYVIAAT